MVNIQPPVQMGHLWCLRYTKLIMASGRPYYGFGLSEPARLTAVVFVTGRYNSFRLSGASLGPCERCL